LRLTILRGEARYELLDGLPLAIGHHGEQALLADRLVVLSIPPIPASLPPRQPEGRAPLPHTRQLQTVDGVDPSVRLEDPNSKSSTSSSGHAIGRLAILVEEQSGGR